MFIGDQVFGWMNRVLKKLQKRWKHLFIFDQMQCASKTSLEAEKELANCNYDFGRQVATVRS